jgi:hypothetical protein
MFSTQLRQSNTRKRSIPPWLPADETGAPHCRDSWCNQRRWSRAAASASQHVRRAFADLSQPLPRIFGQEPHDTSKVAPPQHSSDRSSGTPGHRPAKRGDVVCPHPGGQQRLVAVAHGRVGHQDTLLSFIQSAKPSGRAHQYLLGARLDHRHVDRRHPRRRRIGGRQWTALGFGMAVDGDIGK